ncbi:MAG: HIT domain-containing protein [Candidatus Riflebacteria bacterium]|nr:HIT domain-containing protein [Candidatus Riflebacteria bacterium]
MTFKKHLFVLNKSDYIRGKRRPKVDCILCAILRGDPAVESLLITHDELVAVSANLYPYNAGHVLIFPTRHIYDLRELTEAEDKAFMAMTRQCLDLLDRLYTPAGYNIGFNIGDASGASIDHLHQHVVPRYPKELGIVDIISGTKIIIEDPSVTMTRLREAFAEKNVKR